MPQFGGASEKCHECSKTVYLTEKIVIEDKDEKRLYHKACLKCAHCKKTLSLGNYASMNFIFYCKPHFKQLFASKGNYNEGFGKEKLTAKWAPAAAPATSSSVSFVPVESTVVDSSKAERKETPTGIASRFKPGTEVCQKCNKTVYAIEKIVVEDKEAKIPFHKSCLRCQHCEVQLTLGNYASMEGTYYCRPHFKQLFAAKGNFEEGFGKEKTVVPPAAVTAASSPNRQFVPLENTDARAEKKDAPSGVASRFKSASEKCHQCSKTVYATERIVIEDKEEKKVFHKGCLRCQHCQVVLSLGNYAGMGGQFFCKPHFKQLFATKGNYDEGFGRQKHTANWLNQDGAEDAATTTTTTSSTTTSTSTSSPSPTPAPVESHEEEPVAEAAVVTSESHDEDNHVHTHDHDHDHDHHDHDHDHHHHHDHDGHDHDHHDHDHDHDHHDHDHDHHHDEDEVEEVKEDEPVEDEEEESKPAVADEEDDD